MPDRRVRLLSIIALVCAFIVPSSAHTQATQLQKSSSSRRTVRLLLNSGFSGANAWLLLADARGYFRYEGIEVQFTPGRGSYTAAVRMVTDGFDFGFGDVNALIEEASIRQATAPTAVFMLFNRSPSAIIVRKDSPITAPKQLAGRTIIGHPTDVALNTFDAFAARALIDPAQVKIQPDSSAWPALLDALETKKVDGIFGYLSTSMAAIESTGRDPAEVIRFIAYRDVAPDLYGSTLMASHRMIQDEPDIVRAFVRAANRGLTATVNDPDAAISELIKRDSKQRSDVERNRLLRTLNGDMGAAEGRKIGIGDVDAKRLTLAIKLMHDTSRLPRLPAWDEIFTRDFLPPLSDRVKTLGEPAK